MSAETRAHDVLLAVERLGVAYGTDGHPHPALHDVDLVVRRGERVAIVGESGSGKSTLALALARLHPRDARVEGSIRFEGRDVLALDDDRARALRGASIGVVFQDSRSALHPLIRIEDQVAEAWTAHARADRARARELARAALAQVGLDPGRVARAYPHELSGGMRQRVQLAGALALGPALLILDEPTTALDTVTQQHIFDEIERLRAERGFAVLLVTHDLALARERCDRIVRLAHGRVVDVRTARDVALPPALLRRAGPNDGTRDVALAARDLALGYPVHGGIFRSRARTRVVDGISLELARGGTTALVGNSGSGKTSLVRGLLRLQEPEAGRVEYRAQDRAEPVDLLALGPRALRAVRPDLSVVFQDPTTSLDPRRRVRDVLAEALAVRSREGHEDRIRGLLADVALSADHLERFPHQLSGGEAQRLCLARALATEPRVLVLDEALASLDGGNRERVLALVARRRDAGLAVLLVTHDLGSVESLADRVCVLARGRIVESGPTERIFADPRHDETRALLAARPGHRSRDGEAG